MIKLDVSYTPSEEVQQLRREIAQLQHKAKELDADNRRLEYRYCCELQMKDRLVDYVRGLGVRIPDNLLRRPY